METVDPLLLNASFLISMHHLSGEISQPDTRALQEGIYCTWITVKL